MLKNIKNLTSIFVEQIIPGFNNKYNNIRFSTDEGTYEINYKDKNYNQLLSKLIETYDMEKQNRNIILFGDMAKQIFEGKLYNYNKSKNNGMTVFDEINVDVIFSLDFIKYLIELIFRKIYKIKIDNVTIYNIGNQFQVEYYISYKKNALPLIINIGSNNVEFSFLIYYKSVSKFDCKITKNKNEIGITFESNTPYKGSITYDMINKTKEEILMKQDDLICYEKKKIKSIKNKSFDYFIKFFDLNFNELLYITDNYALSTNENVIFQDKENTVIEKNMIQIYKSNKKVIIRIESNIILSKYNNMYQIILDHTKKEIKVIMIDYNSKSVGIIEQQIIDFFNNKEVSYDFIESLDGNFISLDDLNLKSIKRKLQLGENYDK